jgi:hypothetical protein
MRSLKTRQAELAFIVASGTVKMVGTCLILICI